MAGLKLGIMTATTREYEKIAHMVDGANKEVRGGVTYVDGEIYDRRVTVCRSDIGKVCAAISTTVLLDRYECDAIIFVGSAGGLFNGCKIGDIVIGTELVQHDMDCSPLMDKLILPSLDIARLPVKPEVTQFMFDAASSLVQSQEFKKVLAKPGVSEELGITAPKVHKGVIVTGDKFVATAATRDGIMSAIPDAYVAEMEGAAMAQVCYTWGAPYAVVRAVSDECDNHIDFNKFCDLIVGDVMEMLVKTILQDPQGRLDTVFGK
ncbi:MTA/SAH nucleosidase [Kipferlia bialata]|uniref:adenosylhomocysteine nucleosidase n=1 Tax=Kipferlia bialata TaxID=797122 RepID=A0A9K3CPZ8_9EUKA|nr:MTA/SAH nucleosidase [Kipferlia bialata]|eukprot:g976.t1